MNWLDIFYAFLSLLGGIGVFLYGMKLMGDSLEMVAGNEIKRMFAKISNKKLIGVGIGTVTTAVVQSSAAIIVMSMGFVNSGLMSLTQSIAISYGANIGTCVTALIVAVGVGGFADVQLTVIFAALAGVGALMIMFTKKDKVKKIGGIITGLGMIFVGLSVMTSSMSIFSQSDKISAFLAKISNPALLLLFGILFTALIQSSSAVSGIVITMVASVPALLQFDQALYIILGSNKWLKCTAKSLLKTAPQLILIYRLLLHHKYLRISRQRAHSYIILQSEFLRHLIQILKIFSRESLIILQ